MANNVKAATRDAASALLSLPIQFYRLFLSPFLGCNCRFEPS